MSERCSEKEIHALTRYVSIVSGRRHESGDGKRATELTPVLRPWVERRPAQYRTFGKKLFKETCAGCHALADAGAHGTRVDLDAALAPVPDKAAVIRRALRESPAMPPWAGILNPSEVDALVLYLSEVAGKGR